MNGVLSEGMFEPELNYGKEFFAKTALPPTWIDGGAKVQLTPPYLQLDGKLLPSGRDAATAMRQQLATKRGLVKQLGSTSTLSPTIYIPRNATWLNVANLGETLEAAGETNVVFIVQAAESKQDPPPHSAISDEMDKTFRGDDPIHPEVALKRLAQPRVDFPRCDAANRLNEEVASEPHSDRSKREKIAREMPARILSCSCDVDLASYKTRFWAMMRRPYGVPVAAVPLTLSKTGVQLEARQSETWQDTVERVISASREGKPVHFAVR